jgi:hypothetical protein
VTALIGRDDVSHPPQTHMRGLAPIRIVRQSRLSVL